MVIWWIALLCLAIWKPFVSWFVHVDSKCGHMSIVLFGHNVQLGLGVL